MTYPHEIVTEASRHLLAKGIKILQGNRLGATELEHLERLAGHMGLNGERTVVDMGSGFGEMSRILHERFLPQAHFWLINSNQFQFEHSPEGPAFSRRSEDMCATSVPPRSIDLVMFNYSLCHVEQRAALTEAARIARVGRACTPVRAEISGTDGTGVPSLSSGKLFIYDYERVKGDNERTRKYLAAEFLTDQEFREACTATGWRDVETIHPGGDDSLFRDLFTNKKLYDEMFAELAPVIWKAHR